jgi:hypothetical protein
MSIRRANQTTASADPTPADIRKAVKNPDNNSQKIYRKTKRLTE